MWDWVLKKIVGTKNERTLKKIEPFVREINALEPGLALKSERS